VLNPDGSYTVTVPNVATLHCPCDDDINVRTPAIRAVTIADLSKVVEHSKITARARSHHPLYDTHCCAKAWAERAPTAGATSATTRAGVVDGEEGCTVDGGFRRPVSARSGLSISSERLLTIPALLLPIPESNSD